jgi:hypothetical protein
VRGLSRSRWNNSTQRSYAAGVPSTAPVAAHGAKRESAGLACICGLRGAIVGRRTLTVESRDGSFAARTASRTTSATRAASSTPAFTPVIRTSPDGDPRFSASPAGATSLGLVLPRAGLPCVRDARRARGSSGS